MFILFWRITLEQSGAVYVFEANNCPNYLEQDGHYHFLLSRPYKTRDTNPRSFSPHLSPKSAV